MKATKANSQSQMLPEKSQPAPIRQRLWQRLQDKVSACRKGFDQWLESFSPCLDPDHDPKWRDVVRALEVTDPLYAAEKADVIVLLQTEPVSPQALLQRAGSTQRLVTIRPEDYAAHRCFVAIPVMSMPSDSALSVSPATSCSPGPCVPTPVALSHPTPLVVPSCQDSSNCTTGGKRA